MQRLYEFLRRLSVLFRREQFDRELEEELSFHLEMQKAANRSSGMAAREAGYAASRQFGNKTLLLEKSREMWGWGPVERVGQDLKYAFRMLRKNPGFSAIAITVLALGIGANTAIYSAVNALLLNPFPFPESERIVLVEANHVSGQNSGAGYRDFLDWRAQNGVFDGMMIVPWTGTQTLTGRGEPQRIAGGFTTAGFARVVGVQPLLGRAFAAEEDRPGAPRVAVLSYAAWQQRFGGRADILGQIMTLDGRPHTIIGVMPRRFAFPGIQTCEFWAPLRENPDGDRFQHQYSVVARLKQGIAVERARADMTAIARRLESEYPESNRGWGISVTPARQAFKQQAGMPLAVLSSAVLFILLLACANVAGMMLARASGRAHEMAVRASLGASRSRLIRQMLTECLLMASFAGGLGLLLARWLMDLLSAAAPNDLGLDSVMRLDANVLGFALAISLLTAVVFGLVPAMYGSKSGLNAELKGGASLWTCVRSRNRFLSCLVAGEVTLSLVVLIATGLLVKDLLWVLRLDTGVRVEQVLTFSLHLPNVKYPTVERAHGFYRELLARLRALHGVEAAAAVATLPMTFGYSGGALEIEGRSKPADWVEMMIQDNSSTPGYFAAMGIPLLRGRDFDDRDTAGGLPVAIIDDSFARRFFPGEDPLGRRVKYRRSQWRTIIGVVGSVKHQQPMRAPVPMAYFPQTQAGAGPWVALRFAGDPAMLAAGVRRIVSEMDGDLPIVRLRTMRQVIEDSLSEPRLLTSFLAGFAIFGLTLATIGIYGVIGYSVSRRTHELGIRIALGATYSSVMGLMLRKGILLAAAGVLIGVPAALAGTRLIGSLLYGVSPHDGSIFAGVPLLLLAVSLAASYIPARRAARVDPVEALRHD